MSWERDPLWAKAKLFFERAFDEPRDGPLFGLWCSLGLELLARAAVAWVSPLLLAEPDASQKWLLHALNRGTTERESPKSINTVQVFLLCKTLFPGPFEKDLKPIFALINRRNQELHTGEAAFAAYSTGVWLADFYGACRWLAQAMGESLETLFGHEEANEAELVLNEERAQAIQRAKKAIAACAQVWAMKPKDDQVEAAKQAQAEADRLAHMHHHRVRCPACTCAATVQGESNCQ